MLLAQTHLVFEYLLTGEKIEVSQKEISTLHSRNLVEVHEC